VWTEDERCGQEKIWEGREWAPLPWPYECWKQSANVAMSRGMREVTTSLSPEVRPIKRHCAVVLGGYVNGYNIIRELYELGVRDIYLLDYSAGLGSRSNKIKGFTIVRKGDAFSLLYALERIHEKYDYLILFPTDDSAAEVLAKCHDELSNYCFIPLNPKNFFWCLDKRRQYQACKSLGVPVPKTVYIERAEDLAGIPRLSFPVIVKPATRKDMSSDVFRSLYLDNFREFKRHEAELAGFVGCGIGFLASEVISGSARNIFSYMGYRSKNGRILNEWVGRKLSQYPHDFGVFASASNECPAIVAEQGRALLNGMDLYGINQCEFKHDARDGCYKLMEINLRSMMWHRVGNRTGVTIQYTQYLDAMGLEVPRQSQIQDRVVHLIYLKHELVNLVTRKGYLRVLLQNLFACDERSFAVFDYTDLRPFLFDWGSFVRDVVGVIFRRGAMP
jgi:D-aspartate ligase